MLTQQELKENLLYNPITGIFIWIKPRKRVKVGNMAGYKDDEGYIYIRFNKKLYQAHRLAFFYMTGKMPFDIIDHKNNNASDNSWVNLRELDRGKNQQNRIQPSRNNKCGFLGVSPNGKRFAATIKIEGEHKYLGTFNTPTLASKEYLRVKKLLHPECLLI
jgi:hypothetical protein